MKGHTILYIEDDPDLAAMLPMYLRSQGYRVLVALTGTDGLRIAQTETPDLILLDVMLPKKDGFEVCREVRRAGVRTPILMLTAKTQEAEKVMGLDLGADDYLTKPYGRHELRARVRALIRRAAPESEETCRFGDVEVDFGRAEVRRGGERLDLTPLEFKLMAAFVRRRGRVLSRQQLLDAAWGSDMAITERVVDNQILNLRRKVEPDPAHPRYISSVRGLGYRFDG
jgi:DNA-binding response OmpR family regulator